LGLLYSRAGVKNGKLKKATKLGEKI